MSDSNMPCQLNDKLIFHGTVAGSIFLCNMELKQAIKLIRTPHFDHVSAQAWADLGAGTGLFTRALSQLIGQHSTIYAVDRKAADLEQIKATDHVTIEKVPADFIKDDLRLQGLTGILMANSLHYVKDQLSFLNKMKASFAGEGRFVIVEYDTDKANPWVPYPLSFNSLTSLFTQAGYTLIEKINETPSKFNGNNIYAAWVS
jgi:ubiquinone/menaquinone biosynthesis C-methylase UbiE